MVATAAKTSAHHVVPNAEAGVGFIIQGSSCILPEGRTSPGTTCADTPNNVLRLAPMVAAVHTAGAAVMIRLGHGGLFAMEVWHEPDASQRQGPLLAVSKVPLAMRPAFQGVPVHVFGTDEVYDIAGRYADTAAWSREAGNDGVQLGSANARLLDQFLSPLSIRCDDHPLRCVNSNTCVAARIPGTKGQCYLPRASQG